MGDTVILSIKINKYELENTSNSTTVETCVVFRILTFFKSLTILLFLYTGNFSHRYTVVIAMCLKHNFQTRRKGTENVMPKEKKTRGVSIDIFWTITPFGAVDYVVM